VGTLRCVLGQDTLLFQPRFSCIFEVDCCPGSGFRLDRRLKPDYFSGEEKEGACKGKISARINPWRVTDFSSEIFLIQSSLGKFLICCVRNVYNTVNGLNPGVSVVRIV